MLEAETFDESPELLSDQFRCFYPFLSQEQQVA